MKHPVIFLAVALLFASSCGPAADTTTTSSADTTTTSGQPSSALLYYACPVTSSNAGVAGAVLCASYAQNVSSDVSQNQSVTSALLGDGIETLGTPEGPQMCAFVPGQVFAFPAFPQGAIPAGFQPAEVEALSVYLETVQLGLYDITDGDDVFTAIAELEALGVVASPHYILVPVQTWVYGPAGLPVPTAAGWHEVQKQSGASGSVVIVDTGGVADDPGTPNSNLGVTHAEPEPPNLGPEVRHHGQFAASMANAYNTNLEIEIYAAGSVDQNGNAVLNELSLIAALDRAQPHEEDIVNLSLGTYPCNPSDPPLALTIGLTVMPHELDMFSEAMVELPADFEAEVAHIVAASGNDGEKGQAMFPAMLGMLDPQAFLDYDQGGFVDYLTGVGVDPPSPLLGLVALTSGLEGRITAVGALTRPVDDPDGGYLAEQVSWSNLAEVYVPGEDVVGWYDFGSTAAWSGTSFAAPRFAACLASGDCIVP